MAKCFLLIILTVSFNSLSAKISSFSIAKSTVSALPRCLEYRVIGLCFWLDPASLGKPNVTPKVSHYVPEVVVSVFNQIGSNPWIEINKWIDNPIDRIMQSIIKRVTGYPLGGGEQSISGQLDNHLKFKEVNIIGNPLLSIWKHPVLLPTKMEPFALYFHSLREFILWRMGVSFFKNTEMNLSNQWGPIPPTDGFVTQPDDVKTAALMVSRALIHTKLPDSCGEQCGVESESDPASYKWQKLYPRSSNHCGPLITENVIPSKDYLWNLWRKYKGCLPHSGIFLYSLDF